MPDIEIHSKAGAYARTKRYATTALKEQFWHKEAEYNLGTLIKRLKGTSYDNNKPH